MKANKFVNFFVLFFSAFVIAGLFSFAHICNGMGDMEPPCVSTRNNAVTAGVILGSLSLINLFVSKRVMNIVLSVLQLAGSIVLILIPVVISPVCDMKTMHCYVYSRPLIIITGIIIAVTMIINIAVLIKTKKE